MNKQQTVNRMREIGRKLRRGQGTEAEATELRQLEDGFYTKSQPVRTIFDLVIARRMWVGDAKSVER